MKIFLSYDLKRLLSIGLLVVATAFARETDWVRQDGRFAVFETPPAVKRNDHLIGIDSILEIYESPSLGVAFDGGVAELPPSVQADFERTLAAWTAHCREGHWSRTTYVENGGGIHGSEIASFPGELPYDLYFGFAVPGEDKPARPSGHAAELGMDDLRSFAVTVHFANPGQLSDVERLLKSMKFKHG